MTTQEFGLLHKIQFVYFPAPLKKTDPKDSFRYLVRFELAGRPTLEIEYWKGAAHVGYPLVNEWVMLTEKERQLWKRKIFDTWRIRCAKPIPPQPWEVFDCILSDTQCFLDAPIWEDFASNLGYNSDSIKDKKVFEAVSKQTHELQQFLGQQRFAEFMKCQPTVE